MAHAHLSRKSRPATPFAACLHAPKILRGGIAPSPCMRPRSRTQQRRVAPRTCMIKHQQGFNPHEQAYRHVCSQSYTRTAFAVCRVCLRLDQIPFAVVCMHTCVYIHIYIYRYVFTYSFVYSFTHFIYYLLIYLFVSYVLFTCIFEHTYIYTHTYIDMYIYIYTYTHTYILTYADSTWGS